MIKHLILGPVAAACLALPAYAEKIALSEISAYLNGLSTARGAFTQINDDQSISEGEISIKRPGRVRFDYKAPDNSLVIAGGGQVAIFDPKSNAPPEQFPLNRTPLGLILAKRVNLNQSNMVVGHSQDGTATVVRVQDPKHPEYGNIALKFTDNPVQLRQWVITNDVGDQTTVILRELESGVSLRARLFNIVQEIEARGLN